MAEVTITANGESYLAEVVHEEEAMWCRVQKRKTPLWGDTDKTLCEVAGHDIGPSGCYTLLMLTIRPLDDFSGE